MIILIRIPIHFYNPIILSDSKVMKIVEQLLISTIRNIISFVLKNI